MYRYDYHRASKTVYPPPQLVFSAMNLTPLHTVKGKKSRRVFVFSYQVSCIYAFESFPFTLSQWSLLDKIRIIR